MTYTAAVERLRSVAAAAAQLEAVLPNGVPNMATVRVRLAEGIPALTGEPLIDWSTVARNVQTFGGDLDDMGRVIGRDVVVQAALAASWTDVPTAVSEEAMTLLDYAARPALRAGYAAVRAAIGDANWDRGRCPACGALPILAELRSNKDGESRVLRCGRCTAAWSFARLACPSCNEREHSQLRYLHVDGEVDRRRAECCLTCGFYVKAVARLDPIDDAALLDMELATIALDALAMEAGYDRAESF